MKAEELDRKFDNGEDVLEYFDLSTARRPGLETEHMDIDFPHWVMKALEEEAQRLGVQKEAVVKMWIAQRLDGKVA